jgi:NADPH:quinone reductase-like Zn-dependent oxidoreductase
MRGVVMRQPGGPEVLELQEISRPGPIPTEVLVRVMAAGVNPVDWKVRASGGRGAAVGDPPFILGWDVAGVVEELGRGVTRFAPGDRVFGMPWFPRLAGAYAEYVTSPSRQLARAPEALTDEQAGALPLVGLTAWQALVDVAGVGDGDRVLVHAAAGGVGHIAVQIAKARGAYVFGTAQAAKHRFLREIGVDEPIDYTEQPFEEVASEIDVVLDPVGTKDYELRSLNALRDGGLLIPLPGGVDRAVATAAQEQSKRAIGVLVEPDYAALESLAALAEEGSLTVAVERIFPLEQAAEAQELVRTGSVQGKVVLTP